MFTLIWFDAGKQIEKHFETIESAEFHGTELIAAGETDDGFEVEDKFGNLVGFSQLAPIEEPNNFTYQVILQSGHNKSAIYNTYESREKAEKSVIFLKDTLDSKFKIFIHEAKEKK
tara:strand:+ start:330 stop:677 length:348 start_codon:yes stop_codon:yes gene_type:complete